MLGKWPLPDRLSEMSAWERGLWIRRLLVRAQEGQCPVHPHLAFCLGLRLWLKCPRGCFLPSQAPCQGEESGVLPQRREPRIDQQVGQHGRALLIRALQIAERRVALPEAGVHQREPVGRHVAAGRRRGRRQLRD
jgi:hypothetical protein